MTSIQPDLLEFWGIGTIASDHLAYTYINTLYTIIVYDVEYLTNNLFLNTIWGTHTTDKCRGLMCKFKLHAGLLMKN